MVASILDILDALLYFLPKWGRIALLGGVLGYATMLLYGQLLDQQRVSELKEEASETRKKLLTYDGAEFGPLLGHMKRSILLSLKQLKVMALPASLASIPILLVAIWMHEAYSHRLPEPGESVELRVPESSETSQFEFAVEPSEKIERSSDGSISVIWPEQGEKIVVREKKESVPLVKLPLTEPRRYLSKYSAWHIFYANPIGYLPSDASVPRLVIELPDYQAHRLGPKWLRGWIALFFGVVSIAAVFAKIVHDID